MMKKHLKGKLALILLLVGLLWSPEVFAEIKLTAEGLTWNLQNNDVALSGDYAAVNSRDSVYIFKQTAESVWEYLTTIPNPENDETNQVDEDFASAVEFSGDYLFIGAESDHEKAPMAGSVHVYQRQEDNIWEHTDKLYGSNAIGGEFGHTIVASGDYLIVGASRDDEKGIYSGSASIFKKDAGGVWQFMEKLTASDGTGYERFGSDVDIEGGYAISGAPKASGKGAAYIYQKNDDETWTQVARLRASDPASIYRFGGSVAISGSFAMVGCHYYTIEDGNSGSVDVFERKEEGRWVFKQKLTLPFGTDDITLGTSLLIKNDIALITSYTAVYVYKYVNDTWTKEYEIIVPGESNYSFDRPVDFSNDLLLTRNLQEAYLFKIDPQGRPFVPSDVTASDGLFSDHIQITWSDAPGAKQYEVFRADKPASQGGVLQKIHSTSSTTYNDTHVDPFMTYYYWVRAKNAFGVSEFSLFDTGYYTKLLSPPPAPTGITASDGMYKDRIQITWDSSPDASSYDIYRSVTKTTEKITIGKSLSNTFTDTHLAGQTQYYYWVKTIGEFGESEFSAGDLGSVLVENDGDSGAGDGGGGGGCFIHFLQQ